MRGRVRWGNVGRAVAAVAVVALVVAWPRLDGGPLEVPGGAAVPVAPTPAGDAGARPGGRCRRPLRPEPGERARRHGRSVTQRELRAPSPAAPRQGARGSAAGAAPRRDSGAPGPGSDSAAGRARTAAGGRAGPDAPRRRPRPTVDPAEREFGFER